MPGLGQGRMAVRVSSVYLSVVDLGSLSKPETKPEAIPGPGRNAKALPLPKKVEKVCSVVWSHCPLLDKLSMTRRTCICGH